MSKKVAFLVDVAYCTRVVVEVPDNFDEEEGNPYDEVFFNDLAEKAGKQIIERINNGETGENITDLWVDTEVPYDPDTDK